MAAMDAVSLGGTDLKITRMCIGTATFGGQCSEQESHLILDRVFEYGINFIDTADKYPLGSSYESAGISEEIVGRWLKTRSQNSVVATKVHGPTGPDPWNRGLGRRHIEEAVEASLRRLQVEAIDLYQLHRPDSDTPIDETLGVLNELVIAGKVRYIGVSNFMAYQIAQASSKSESLELVKPIAVQLRYNLLFRQPENELLPFCEEENLGVLAYNPLAGGMLTGKHVKDLPPSKSSRFGSTGAAELYRGRYWNDAAFEAVGRLSSIAADLDLSLTTMATAWLSQQPMVTSVILGATKVEQLDLALSSFGVNLDHEVLREIDDLTKIFRAAEPGE